MSYHQKHILIYDPKTGYNTIAQEYALYHKHLDSFDKGVFVKYFPKKTGISVIDLGAGDGRLYKYLSGLSPTTYVACDIAERLLNKHPGKHVKKVVCDLEQPLPFENDSFDLATSFFVLEHIAHLDGLFSEVYRILQPGGQRIIGHFIQRREFVRKKDKQQFKIQYFRHRRETLHQIAHNHFFTSFDTPLYEQGVCIGHIIILKK